MPDSPPDSWFVVRGGLFSEPANVLLAVNDALEDGFGPTASVHAGIQEEGETFAAALERICRFGGVKHRQVRVTTVSRLVEAGFTVELDTSDGQPACHHNVVFTEPPNIDQAKLFIECFDAPVPNPAKD